MKNVRPTDVYVPDAIEKKHGHTVAELAERILPRTRSFAPRRFLLRSLSHGRRNLYRGDGVTTEAVLVVRRTT